MLENNVIPIVNENDTISVSELMFTDNDELSGLIASMMDTQALIILSNIDGIKRVQRVSSGCCNKSTRILSRFPLAIITVIPSSATLRAILVFVNIPPRPKLDLVV